MSNWTKVKNVVAMKDDDPEEIEDKPIYEDYKTFELFHSTCRVPGWRNKITRRDASMPEDKK